jgi:hypothetical protein
MGEKTYMPLPRALCPFCRHMRRVMPSNLFELHTITGHFGKAICRGGGQRVTLAKAIK